MTSKFDAYPPMRGEARRLLRSAVTAAMGLPGSTSRPDDFGAAKVSELTRDQLLAACEHLGVPAMDIITRVNAATAETFSLESQDDAPLLANASAPIVDARDLAAASHDIPAVDVLSDGSPAEIVTEIVTPAENVRPDDAAVDAAVKSALAPMGAGDMAGFQTALRGLAAASLVGTRPATITRTVTRTIERTVAAPAVAPAGAVPYATKGGTLDAGTVFGVQGPMAGIPVRLWHSAPGSSVPRRDPAFVFDREICGVLAACLSRSSGLLLHGPRGVGKTTLVKQIAAATGREYVRISCTDTTEACSLLGMVAPTAAGGVIWKDGALTAAIQRPGTLILIDEPSVARPGAIFVLQALMDGERAIALDEDGGRVVPMADGVTIILADNTNGTGDTSGQYAGTGQLNAATLDRCLVSIGVSYLDPVTEAGMVSQRTGCRPALAKRLAEFAAASRQAADKADLAEGMSPRRVIALAHLMHLGVPFTLAFETAVLGSCTVSDREHYSQMVAPLVNAGLMDKAARGLPVTDPEAES